MVHEQHEQHERILFADEVFQIQGAVYEVNGLMGAGFLEAVYQECLELEFKARGIPFVANAPLTLTYKGESLRQVYRADFVCFERIIIELKALPAIAPEHRAQVLNYLRVTGHKLGLLVNFGCAPKAHRAFRLLTEATASSCCSCCSWTILYGAAFCRDVQR